MTPPNETPTPRTDRLAEQAGLMFVCADHDPIVVPVELSRQLERELQAAQAANRALEWQVKQAAGRA